MLLHRKIKLFFLEHWVKILIIMAGGIGFLLDKGERIRNLNESTIDY